MKKLVFLFGLFCCCLLFFGQKNNLSPAVSWADSVFKTLSPDEKLAQLMVIRAHSNLGPDHVQQVTNLIKKYNIGALCFFQGGPVRQANLTNFYQSIAKTPILITIDGEWGLGMRLDSITRYPYQLTLGALKDDKLVYQMGLAVGEQMKRIGVHVNYAPVVDINNNPANPVIGYRSFGSDKYKVSMLGAAYTRGMQDAGIMACAKHFPGHGDVDVDSHLDLPVINKPMTAIDSLELLPFKRQIETGVGSVMIAHLSIPAIDNTPNRPTSLSKKNVTDLLRNELHFAGLTFTDALEMKGVSKYYPSGEAAVQALIAGNDMLCLPADVQVTIDAVKTAIKKKRLSWDDINEKVKKVLLAKYNLGLNKPQVVDMNNLLADLNSKTDAIRAQVAASTVTVLRNSAGFLPIIKKTGTAYVAIGLTTNGALGERLKKNLTADTYFLSYKDNEEKASQLLKTMKANGYERVIIGMHSYSLRPADNYGISKTALSLWDSLQAYNAATFVFGNVYAAQNFCKAATLVAMYQDDEITQNAAADFLEGKIAAKGVLPAAVCNFAAGSGLAVRRFVSQGTEVAWLTIDSIVADAIERKAFPGCEVLAVQDGEIRYHKAFGHYGFDPASTPVSLESIYDLASVTKISATTVAVMKLYENGKISLDSTLGSYLPYLQGSDKANLKVSDVLLHQAGLVPFISFYKESLDAAGAVSPALYKTQPDTLFTIPVARNLWLRRDWNDTMLLRIRQSPLTTHGRYVYSDNDFILLGKIVETLSGIPLDQYVQKNFYSPLSMVTTGFKPWQRFGVERVVPTEDEPTFRRQLLQSYVHDEGAAMFGGVSGHAGLFSNAYDLSLLYQMLLNGGQLNDVRLLKPETIRLFTAYHSDSSRRGYGFDKPEKDNATRREPYPARGASPQTFGHTGFTGTCVWVDPAAKLVYIFLSNRVYPTRNNNGLSSLGVRSKIMDAIYTALRAAPLPSGEVHVE